MHVYSVTVAPICPAHYVEVRVLTRPLQERVGCNSHFSHNVTHVVLSLLIGYYAAAFNVMCSAYRKPVPKPLNSDMIKHKHNTKASWQTGHETAQSAEDKDIGVTFESPQHFTVIHLLIGAQFKCHCCS
jgi:hypothetical protein